MGFFLHDNYGLRFSIVKFEGIRMELILVSIVNLISNPRHWSLALGTIVAISLFIYYGLYAFFIYKFIKEIQAKIAELPKETVEARGELVEVVDFDELPNGPNLKFLFEDMAVPSGPWAVYSPLVNICRDMTIQIFLLLFSRTRSMQLFYILLVEVIYAVYVIKTRQKYSAWGNRLDCFNRIMFPLYTVMKLVSFLPIAEADKQSRLGLIMGGVLLVIAGVNILFSLILSFFIIGRAIKDIICGCNKKKKDGEKEADAPQQRQAEMNESAMPVVDQNAKGNSKYIDLQGKLIVMKEEWWLRGG
jgi:hypothetical protein